MSLKLGYLTTLGGFTMMLFGGQMFLWGNISTYVVSYFYYKGDKNASLKSAQALIPLNLIFQSIFNPIGAYL